MIRHFRQPNIFALSLAAFLCLSGIGGLSSVRAQDAEWARDEARLTRMITSGDVEAKREALFQIRNLRSERASRLAIPALADANPIVRATAAASVIFLPKNEAVTALSPLVGDKEPFVRKEAAYALGFVVSPLAADPLIRQMRREKDLEVKAAIAAGLGGTGNAAAVDALAAELKRSPKEENEFVRRSAARAIGQIAQIIKSGDAYVVTPQDMLPAEYKKLTGDDLTLRQPVFSNALATLTRVLQNRSETDDTRREAAFALGAIGSQASRNVLSSYLKSDDPYLAEICREALLKLDLPTR